MRIRTTPRLTAQPPAAARIRAAVMDLVAAQQLADGGLLPPPDTIQARVADPLRAAFMAAAARDDHALVRRSLGEVPDWGFADEQFQFTVRGALPIRPGRLRQQLQAATAATAPDGAHLLCYIAALAVLNNYYRTTPATAQAAAIAEQSAPDYSTRVEYFTVMLATLASPGR